MKQNKELTIRNRVDILLKGLHNKATFITFNDLHDEQEHLVIALGDPQQTDKPPLVRLHSECLTGDVFRSTRCDCGPQLNESLQLLDREGGYIVYLRQEGRGIGLYNKLDAYLLQEQGYDTFQSNNLLGFADDLRDYSCAAQMLKSLDLKQIRLFSNNPDKRAQLTQYGIDVKEQVSTSTFVNINNHYYLRAKVEHRGHLLQLDSNFQPSQATNLGFHTIRHSSPQSGIAANAQYVATAGYDNQLILWDPKHKSAIARGVHDHLVNQISFSPCGQFIVSSSSDYSARLWSIPEMRLQAVFNAHSDDVEGVAFHKTKNWIATCSRDATIALYDLTGNLIRQFVGHKKDVISLGWLSDSEQLVSSSDDGTIKVWCANSGELLKDINLDGVETDTVAINPSGIIYAGNDNGELVIIDGNNIEHVKAHKAGIKRLVFDEQQMMLVSLSYDRKLCLWQCSRDASLTLLQEAELPAIVWPRSCAFKDADTVVFVTFGDCFAEYKISENRWYLDHINPTGGYNAVAYWNQEVYTVGDAGNVKKNGEIVAELGSLCNFLEVVGDNLITGGQSGSVFNALTGEVYYTHHSPLNCLVQFENNGQRYAMVGTYTGEGLVFGVNHHTLNKMADVQLNSNAIKGLAASGNEVFSVSADASVSFYDIANNKVTKTIENAHDKIVNACSVDLHNRFYSVSRDRSIKVWQNHSAKTILTPSKHSIKCIAVTSGGEYIAIGTYSGNIGVYCSTRERWIYWQRRTPAGISSIIKTSNTAFLASAYDGKVYLVDVETILEEQWRE